QQPQRRGAPGAAVGRGDQHELAEQGAVVLDHGALVGHRVLEQDDVHPGVAGTAHDRDSDPWSTGGTGWSAGAQDSSNHTVLARSPMSTPQCSATSSRIIRPRPVVAVGEYG